MDSASLDTLRSVVSARLPGGRGCRDRSLVCTEPDDNLPGRASRWLRWGPESPRPQIPAGRAHKTQRDRGRRTGVGASAPRAPRRREAHFKHNNGVGGGSADRSPRSGARGTREPRRRARRARGPGPGPGPGLPSRGPGPQGRWGGRRGPALAAGPSGSRALYSLGTAAARRPARWARGPRRLRRTPTPSVARLHLRRQGRKREAAGHSPPRPAPACVLVLVRASSCSCVRPRARARARAAGQAQVAEATLTHGFGAGCPRL